MVFDLVEKTLICAMKHFPFFTFLLLTLSSCAVYNHIARFSAGPGDATGLMLQQHNRISAAGGDGLKLEAGSKESIISTFRFVQPAGSRPEITVDFRLKGIRISGQADSIVYFVLNGETIKIEAEKGGAQNNLSAATATDGTEHRRILVPENLWVSVANAGTIQYRLGEGENSIAVILNLSEKEVLKQFFQKACNLRDAAFPEIPKYPPGLKKW